MRDFSLALHFPARVPSLTCLFGYLIVRIIVLSMCLVCRIYDLLLVQSIYCCEKVVIHRMCMNENAPRGARPVRGVAVARCPGARGPARRGNVSLSLLYTVQYVSPI